MDDALADVVLGSSLGHRGGAIAANVSRAELTKELGNTGVALLPVIRRV